MAEINRDVDALVARVAELERIVTGLATAPRATNTSVKGGAFQVLDVSGVQRARLGLLSDGVSYGLEVDDASGVPIDVGRSLFGIAADRAVTVTQITEPYATRQTVGPSVPVTAGQSGRVLVVATCRVRFTTATNASSGETGIALIVGVDGTDSDLTFDASIYPPATSTGQPPGGSWSVAGADILAMSPGAHTLNMKAYASPPVPAFAYVENRSIIAFPI